MPKRLVPIFRDREELATATDLGTVINEALTANVRVIAVSNTSRGVRLLPRASAGDRP